MPATVVTDCGSSRFGLVRVSLLRPPQCLFMARQSAACLSLQAADSERCLFGGDCCHSIRHLCHRSCACAHCTRLHAPDRQTLYRQTSRRCTGVIPQTMYRHTSDTLPSNLAKLYRRHTSDAVPSDLRRRLCRRYHLIRTQNRALSVNEDFAGCYSLMGRFTVSRATTRPDCVVDTFTS